MRKNSLFFYILLFVLFFESSCKKENIEPEFQKYVNLFLEEGLKRGRNLYVGNLTIEFNPDKNGASGQCILGSHKVWIGKNNWKQLNDLEKEKLIFHELGHCLLDLTHDNCILPDGSSESIMCGIGGTCDTDYCFSIYSPMKRDYYLDQLFELHPNVPSWADLENFNDNYISKSRSLIASYEFNNLNNISIFVDNGASYKQNNNILDVNGLASILFDDFKQKTLNIENVEIETMFLLNDKSNSKINFSWTPKIDATNYNTFIYQILKTNQGNILTIAINGWTGFAKNIDNYLENENYNKILIQKVGTIIYFFINNKIVYIQDAIPYSKQVLTINGKPSIGEYSIGVNNCKIDYVSVKEIKLF